MSTGQIESSSSNSSSTTSLWQVEILAADGEKDHASADVLSAVISRPDCQNLSIRSAHGYLLDGNLSESDLQFIANHLLGGAVNESVQIGPVGSSELNQSQESESCLYVMLKVGVTDPVAGTALKTIEEAGYDVSAIRTYRKYWLGGVEQETKDFLASRILSNSSIEETATAPLCLDSLAAGNPYQFELSEIDLVSADDDQLMKISRDGGLSLTLVEMQTIQDHFKSLGRKATEIELETVAQTWSEHCSHKTLAGRIEYQDENGTVHFDNMLKETIFKATTDLRESWGDEDWCVSVFKDNAGIVTFDDDFHVCIKVETHNRPSALEPYGGANTGIGGVIRDTLGTGMGAKPICNTDVFCFADPRTEAENIPEGVLHPAQVMRGVVAGVRDYGNRMGIPTVNGAVYFDQNYIGNPLVFCGNIGMIPHDQAFKEPQIGDLIVSLGGRTGRDGIHGATFSSAELTDKSGELSGGAVQIGNAITEKMLSDVLLEARDRGLYTAVTDCGAGGFSSAVGEMGEELGAEVWLEKAPLKYEGLSYTEIWISEAQERMVLSVPESKSQELKDLCDSESVEAAVIGKFTGDKNLHLMYDGKTVGKMGMEFLHDGRPPIVRKADGRVAEAKPLEVTSQADAVADTNLQFCNDQTIALLGQLNIASKHWIIRQYDHQVQGGSVVEPLVGAAADGPSDAAAVRPRIDSDRAVVVSCGMAPTFGDFDPYHMAASGIDEAVRNCVATGADPGKIAVLDNFCWGYTDRPETLGALVRSALACRDLAMEYQTPFISGKDSLNNEFSQVDQNGNKTTTRIPHTLLITALGQVDDAAKCVTMDLKKAGNRIALIGGTKSELGGSHLARQNGWENGQVPTVDAKRAKKIFHALYEAMQKKRIRSCHDLSEGGLSVAVCEMAFAGRLGAQIDLSQISIEPGMNEDVDSLESDRLDESIIKLFSESNSRFLVEVEQDYASEVENFFEGLPFKWVGEVVDSGKVEIQDGSKTLVDCDIETLRKSWQQPLDWS